MKPVTFTLASPSLTATAFSAALFASSDAGWPLYLTHDEYIGLCAALEVGAAQSGGLFTFCNDVQRWLEWRRHQKSGYSDTPTLKRARANCAKRASQRNPDHRGHK